MYSLLNAKAISQGIRGDPFSQVRTPAALTLLPVKYQVVPKNQRMNPGTSKQDTEEGGMDSKSTNPREPLKGWIKKGTYPGDLGPGHPGSG